MNIKRSIKKRGDKFFGATDIDSRLSMRERLAVNESIKIGDLLHVMRDHPAHQVPFGASGMSMLGGMWGIKAGQIKLADRMKQFCSKQGDYYGLDQTFLEDIYIEYNSSMTFHYDFFAKKPFPSKRSGYRFIGERIDDNENPVGDDLKQILSYNKEHHPSLIRRINGAFKTSLDNSI